jgi:hypothetical protein
MIKNLLTILITLISFCSYSQSRHEAVSLVSDNRDTLFLANNKIGNMILDVWNDDYLTEKPIILMKSERWILEEGKNRNTENTENTVDASSTQYINNYVGRKNNAKHK